MELVPAILNFLDSSSESDDEEGNKNNISSFLDSSSDSDSDEELNFHLRKRARFDIGVKYAIGTAIKRQHIRIVGFMEKVVKGYDEEDFIMNFRISRALYKSITNRFENSDAFQKMHADSRRIPANTHIAMFLWFAAHEACSFRDVGDRFNISISSVNRIIVRVTNFISNLAPEAIRWPNATKRANINTAFQQKCVFPRVIGCIDGTHILIDPPAHRKDDYIDRKGDVTLQLQAVCDEKKKFLDVFIGFPGSCHDSWVFQNSPIYEKLPTLCEDSYILGDSAYPCLPNLMTPYKDNGRLTRSQKAYNKKFTRGRVCIEHTFGMLKQRFRQLYYCKLKGLDKLCHFIRACCVLHNWANDDDLPFYFGEEMPAVNEPEVLESSSGKALRDQICRELFNT